MHLLHQSFLTFPEFQKPKFWEVLKIGELKNGFESFDYKIRIFEHTKEGPN